MSLVIEYVRGGKYDRNNLVEVHDIQDVDEWGTQSDESYYSVYSYGPEIHDHLRNTGGKVKGYHGTVSAPYLWWDIDEKDDIERAHRNTAELYERLKDTLLCPSENIRIFFSGRKGFHIIYHSPAMKQKGFHQFLPRIVRLTCEKVAQGINIDTSVYNRGRIFRLPNSIHPDTGLYKVDVTDIFFFGTEGILERAKDQWKTAWCDPQPDTPRILELLNDSEKEANERPNVSSAGSMSAQDLIKMFEEGVDEGERNDSLARVAGFFHHKINDKNFVSALVHMVNRQSVAPLAEGEVDNVVESITSYPVNPLNGGAKQISVANIHTIRTAGKAWFDMFSSHGFTSYGPRLTHMTHEMEMCMPGDVIGIVANSGVGKTLTGVQVGNAAAEANNGRAMIVSIEMSTEGMFFRIAIQESPDLADETGYIRPKNVARALHQVEELRSHIYEEYGRILIVDDATSVDHILQYVQLANHELQKTGEQITELVLDYGQLLDGTEENGRASKIARSMKPLAKFLNLRLYVLLQLNKTIANKYEKPTRNHIEGTGGWFQACDYLLAMYLDKDIKDIIHAYFMKNRWGVEGISFAFQKTGLKLHTIDAVESDVNPLVTDGEKWGNK